MADIDIYDDLELLHAQEQQKAVEDLQWKEKYQVALGIIEKLQAEKKELNKKIKQLEINFASLLDTARTEIKRKDNQIAELRREKDDICFRRNVRPVRKQFVDDGVAEDARSTGSHFNPFTVETQSLVPKSIKTVDRSVDEKCMPSSSRRKDRESERKDGRSNNRETLPGNDRERDRSRNSSRSGFERTDERNFDRRHSRHDRDLSQTGSSDSSREKTRDRVQKKTPSHRMDHQTEKRSNGKANGYASTKQEYPSKYHRESCMNPKKDVQKDTDKNIATLQEEILMDVKQFKKTKISKERFPKPIEDLLKVETEKSDQFLDALFDDIMLNADNSNDIYNDLEEAQSVDTCSNVTEKKTEEIITKTDENCNVEVKLRTQPKQNASKLFDDLFGPSPVGVITKDRRNSSVSSVGELHSDMVELASISADAKIATNLTKKENLKETIPIPASKAFVVADLNMDDCPDVANDGCKIEEKSKKNPDVTKTNGEAALASKSTSAKLFKFIELDSSFYSSEEEDDNEKECTIQSQSDIESPPFENCCVSTVTCEVNPVISIERNETVAEHIEKHPALKCMKSNSGENGNTLQDGERNHQTVGSKSNKNECVKSSEGKDIPSSTRKHDVKNDQSLKRTYSGKQKESQTSCNSSEKSKNKEGNTRKVSERHPLSSEHHNSSDSSSKSRSSSGKDTHRSERSRNEDKHHHHPSSKELTKSKHQHRDSEKSESEKNSSSHKSSRSFRKYSSDTCHRSSREVKHKIVIATSNEKDTDGSKDRYSLKLIWSDGNEENTNLSVKCPLHDDNSSDLKLYQDPVISLHCDDISDEEDADAIMEDINKQKENKGLDEISDEEEGELMFGETPTNRHKQQTTNEGLDEISDDEKEVAESVIKDKHQTSDGDKISDEKAVKVIMAKDEQRTLNGGLEVNKDKPNSNTDEMEKLNIKNKTSSKPENLPNNSLENEDKRSAECVVERLKSDEKVKFSKTKASECILSSINAEEDTTSNEAEPSSDCVGSSTSTEEPCVQINKEMESDCILFIADKEEPSSSAVNRKSNPTQEKLSDCIEGLEVDMSTKVDKKRDPNEKEGTFNGLASADDLKQPSKVMNDKSVELNDFVPTDFVPTKFPGGTTDDIEQPSQVINDEPVRINTNKEKSTDCAQTALNPTKCREIANALTDEGKEAKSEKEEMSVNSENLKQVVSKEKEEMSPVCVPTAVEPMISLEITNASTDVFFSAINENASVPLVEKIHKHVDDEQVVSKENEEKSPDCNPTSIESMKSIKFTDSSNDVSESRVDTIIKLDEVKEMYLYSAPIASDLEEPFKDTLSKQVQSNAISEKSPIQPYKPTNDEQAATRLIDSAVSLLENLDDDKTILEHTSKEKAEPQLTLPRPPTERKKEFVSSGRRRKLKTPRKCTDDGKILKDPFTIMAIVSSRYAKSDDERTSISNKQVEPASPHLRRTQSTSNFASVEGDVADQIQVPTEGVGKETHQPSPEESKNAINPLVTETGKKVHDSKTPTKNTIEASVDTTCSASLAEVSPEEQQEMPALWMEEESREALSVVKASTTIFQRELNTKESKSTATVISKSISEEKHCEAESKDPANHSESMPTCEKESNIEKKTSATPRKVSKEQQNNGVTQEFSTGVEAKDWNVETTSTSVSKKRKREKSLQNSLAPGDHEAAVVTTSDSKIHHKKRILQNSIGSCVEHIAVPSVSCVTDSICDLKKKHKKLTQSPTSVTVVVANEINIHEKSLKISPVKGEPKSIMPSDSKKSYKGNKVDTASLEKKNAPLSSIKDDVVPESTVTSESKNIHNKMHNLAVSSGIDINDPTLSRPDESSSTSDNKRKYKKIILQNFMDSDTLSVVSSDVQNHDNGGEPLLVPSDSKRIHHKKRILQKSTTEESTAIDDIKNAKSNTTVSTSGNRKKHTKKVLQNFPDKDQHKEKNSRNSPGCNVTGHDLVAPSGKKKKRNSNTSQNGPDSDVKDTTAAGRDDNKRLDLTNFPDFNANDSAVAGYEQVAAMNQTNRKYKKRILQHFTGSHIVDSAAVIKSNEQVLQRPVDSSVANLVPVVISDSKKRQKKKNLQNSNVPDSKHAIPAPTSDINAQDKSKTSQDRTKSVKKKYKNASASYTDADVNHCAVEGNDVLQNFPDCDQKDLPELCHKSSLVISVPQLQSPTKTCINQLESTSYPLPKDFLQRNKLEAQTDSIDPCLDVNFTESSTNKQANDEPSLPCSIDVKSFTDVDAQHMEPESITSSNVSFSYDEKERNAINIKRKMRTSKQPKERRKARKLSTSSSDAGSTSDDKPALQPTTCRKLQDQQPPPIIACNKPLPPITKSEKKQRTTAKRKRSPSHDKSLTSISVATPTHHKIFNDDVFPEDQQAILPPVYNANEDDVQYQEIDNRMRSMFQSPTYSHQNGGSSFELANGSALDLQDASLKDNLTIDETITHSEKSQCDTSTSSRKISVGSNEYVIETIGAHSANVFITRKKSKKRMKMAVPTM